MRGSLHIYPSSAQVPVLKVELGRREQTTEFSGRGQSRRTCICRRRSVGMEPVAVLRSQLSVHRQFQDGSEDIFLHC